VREDRLDPLRRVCGIDVQYARNGSACAAAVVVAFPGLEPVERSVAKRPVTFPYVPGFFSLREIPAALAALEGLRAKPDVLLCDGHGVAHPRRFGLACHLGILADLPSIGVAKSRLVGEHREPRFTRGAWAPLLDRGEEIGAVLRTREGVKPVYVSIGHRVSLATAIEIVLACSPRYRIPEPIRAADRLARGGPGSR